MKRRRKPVLPPSCNLCAPFEGRWRMGENRGLERCGCARGRALIEMGYVRKRKPRKAFDGRMAAAGKDGF